MSYENIKRTNTTTTNERMTTTTTETSSSSTRARAYARDAMLEISLESIRQDYNDILGRPMPRFNERQLLADLQENETPSIYYRYALQEAASAPMPSWRYVLAIVARLKRQQVPEDDLMWWM